jgi:hypothetical protein
MSKLELGDLQYAANILENYYDANLEPEEQPYEDALMRVVKFLDAEIARREHRIAVNNAKRAYAEANGIPFSKVRYNSKAGN